MAKRVSTSTALVLIFLVLSVSIVYACSGLDTMRMAFHHSSMSAGTIERGPCSEHKQDICSSVRQRLLSIQASATQPGVSLHSSTIPQEATLGIFLGPKVSFGFLAFLASYHSSFKLSFPFSYRVLRI